jgi:hypothetical protein
MIFLKRLRDAWAVLTGKMIATTPSPKPNADGGPGQPVPPP